MHMQERGSVLASALFADLRQRYKSLRMSGEEDLRESEEDKGEGKRNIDTGAQKGGRIN